MILSDPLGNQPGISGQFGQYNLFMSADRIIKPNHPFVRCGRLRSAPQFFRLSVVWDTIPPVDPSLLQCYQNIALQRDAIRPFVPEPLDSPWSAISKLYAPFPQCVYTCPHWITSTIESGDLLDLKWMLYYGDVTGLAAAQHAGTAFDQTLLKPDFFNFDSLWIDSNPSSLETNSISGQGWVLFLVHRQLSLGDADTTIVSHHPYAGYALDVQTSAASKTPIFEATRPSFWKMFHNAIDLPLNSITLSPLGS